MNQAALIFRHNGQTRRATLDDSGHWRCDDVSAAERLSAISAAVQADQGLDPLRAAVVVAASVQGELSFSVLPPSMQVEVEGEPTGDPATISREDLAHDEDATNWERTS